MQVASKFKVGQLVTALDCAYVRRPVRYRRTFIQSLRGIDNGHAASDMTPGQRYEVENVLSNGGLRLKGFTFTVSPAHVAPARRPAC